MKIAVLGGGFVGVTTAVTFAEQGHDVCIIEPWTNRLDVLASGRVPFFEAGLDEAYAAMHAAGDITVQESLDGAPDIVFICVGTPARPDGGTDLKQVESAAKDIAAVNWADPPVIVVKSTVPPGTTRQTVLAVLTSRLGQPGVAYGLAMNPEFLREGNALADARKPDRVVYGALDALALERLDALYAHVDCPVRRVDLETAELSKYAANALLATKIGFANELARLAEATGTDVDAVFETVGLDHRIAPSFLEAGPGFGGSCFPKDLKALAAVARDKNVELGIIDAVLRSNEEQPEHVLRLIRDAIGDPAGKRIALLGVAFKPGTSDVRETRALPIHQALETAGAHVTVHDPQALDEYRQLAGHAITCAESVEVALEGADLCVIHTHWPQYEQLQPSTFTRTMRNPIIVDTRRLWSPDEMAEAGIDYRCLGRGTNKPRAQLVSLQTE